MHPNASFRPDLPPAEERALCEALIDEIGFGMIFAATPDGPRVAHAPLWSTGDGAVQFHLARGNALCRHIAGETALAVLNGPDAYVSARWYRDPQQVPTWNYISLELEGPVRRMEREGLEALLGALTERHEASIAEGTPWTIDKLSEERKRKLMQAIVGFEMEVRAWRPTLKLSQNRPDDERERLIEGLERQGANAIAHLMRSLAK